MQLSSPFDFAAMPIPHWTCPACTLFRIHTANIQCVEADYVGSDTSDTPSANWGSTAGSSRKADIDSDPEDIDPLLDHREVDIDPLLRTLHQALTEEFLYGTCSNRFYYKPPGKLVD